MGTAAYRNSQAHAIPANSQPVTTAHAPGVTVSINQTVASVGTVATLYAPQVGHRFRLLGGWIALSAADAAYLRGTASANFQLNFRGAAGAQIPLLLPVGGLACGSANSALVVDVGTAGTIVTGSIFLSSEP